MSRFIIHDRQFVENSLARYFSEGALSHNLSRNNDTWEVWRDPALRGIVVKCANKPPDMFFYGLKWANV